MNVSMYEVALRKKIRFDSPKGGLTLEQLWEVPLRSRDDFNLDTIAKAANKAVKELGEETFVAKRKTTEQATAELKLDIIKDVIGVLLSEEAAAKDRAENAKERERLLEALEQKQNDKLANMSEAALKKRLAEVS